jgi:hypothetical protein
MKAPTPAGWKRDDYQFTKELSLRVILDYNATLAIAGLLDLQTNLGSFDGGPIAPTKQFHEPAILHQIELRAAVLKRAKLQLVSPRCYRIKFRFFCSGKVNRKENYVPPHCGKNYGCSRLCSAEGDDQRGPGEDGCDER